MAADVHAQRWTWGTGVETIHSPSTLSALKKEGESRDQGQAASSGEISPVTHLLPTSRALSLSLKTPTSTLPVWAPFQG